MNREDMEVVFLNTSAGTLNLLMNVPKELRDKIIGTYNFEDPTANKIEVIILYGDKPEALKVQVETLGGTFEDLGYGYGIVTIAGNRINELFDIKEINYIELPKNLYLSYELSNRASCVVEASTKYNLSGEGILVGFIDSGIDYMNSAFKTETGETRIEYIYDLSAGGAIYNKTKINEAIKSTNPNSVVPHVDSIGHGTHVAGIACAGGNIPKKYYGVAPKSSIAMVKLARESKQANGKSTQLMRGIKFLTDKANELNKPLSINISFSTNDGAHDGQSLLEQYISVVAKSQRISIAIAAGNEGGRAHHAGGPLSGTQKVQFNVGNQEKIIIIELYKSFLNEDTLKITSPGGTTTSELRLVNNVNTGTLLRDTYFVYNTGPTPFNINGEVMIILSGVGANFLTNGVWTLELTTTTNYKGIYDLWLPIAEGLSADTKFLNPDVSNTLGIPGTVANVITVGSYNYANNTVSTFSGRGNATLTPIKPDISAPGENIESSTPDGGFEALTGTSMATPAVAGACALLMEFGLIKGNDPYLYGQRLKYFLLKGANRTRVDIEYPDNSWGYGTLCVEKALEIWQKEVVSTN